jgi:hypothetical protein
MSLLTENNRQYYEGAQGFQGDGTNASFTTTFNTDLVFGAASNTAVDYPLNNFKLYSSASGAPSSWSEVVSGYSVSGNTITFNTPPANGDYIVVQLKKLDGGNYGSTTSEKAFGDTVEENYGSYAYIKLNDIINNFLVAYVGAGKLIPSVKRTDVIFHAKRGLQEFSYDTLKSIKSQELTVPNNLSIPLPQDYVNYTNVYWIDNQGVKHIIMPVNNLTGSPYTTPIQDAKGVPVQDAFNNNIEGTSIIEKRWNTNDLKNRNINIDDTVLASFYYNYDFPNIGYGELYGLEPQYANMNGYFQLNEREGKISFSNDLVDKIILFEYISDGLALDLDTRVPKLAEEAMYAHIAHAVIASRINQPEYIVQRLKRERSAKLRNAKIRLSNLKLNELVQVMRGKSKWIKH